MGTLVMIVVVYHDQLCSGKTRSVPKIESGPNKYAVEKNVYENRFSGVSFHRALNDVSIVSQTDGSGFRDIRHKAVPPRPCPSWLNPGSA